MPDFDLKFKHTITHLLYFFDKNSIWFFKGFFKDIGYHNDIKVNIMIISGGL